MIKHWRYRYTDGSVSSWIAPPVPSLPSVAAMSPAARVVGVDWEYDTQCREVSPCEIEGKALRCSGMKCQGQHAALYETYDEYGNTDYVEVSWTTPTDSEE